MKRLVVLNRDILYDLASLRYSLEVIRNKFSVSSSDLEVRYLQVVKPKIDALGFVKALSAHSDTRIVTFSSSLSEQGLKFPPFEPHVENLLKHNWEGITSEEIKSFEVIYLLDNLGVLSGVSKSQILSEHPNVRRILFSPWDRGSVPKNPSVETGLVNFSDPALLKLLQVEQGLSGNKYSVDSINTPNNSELGSWGNIVGFARPIDLGLQRIVPGKKLGRTIGIPTCNLNFEEAKLAKFLLIPGVYYGTCQFAEPVDFPFLEPFESKALKMVISIGTNVQFQEKKINFEVMILEPLPNQEFYGQELRVWINGLIRPEAYFPEFSTFIHAMENDIFVAKEKLRELAIFQK